MVSIPGPALAGPALQAGQIPGSLSLDTAHVFAFRGMNLPVLFHGKPDDSITYRSLSAEAPRNHDATHGQKNVAPDNTTPSNLVAVVFNGCIYNHAELRAELQSAGHGFLTDHSDTETLIHGWRRWKADIVEHLRGMYSFAIWDHAGGALFTARDPFAEKPLYTFSDRNGRVRTRAFCSCVRGLTSLMPLLSRPRPVVQEIRRRGLIRWIHSGYGCGLHTRAREVLPEKWSPIGQALQRCRDRRLTHAGVDHWSIWPGPRQRILYDQGTAPENAPDGKLNPPVIRHVNTVPLNEQRLDELLDAAVRARLESDAPIGCFLSGGVDSSLIARYAHAHHGSLRTFCVRMPDRRFDESRWAKKAADLIGTRHETLEISPKPAQDLVQLISRLGLPFGDSSLLPAYWLSRAVREHVKVALCGDGGDELFVGYHRYRGADWLLKATPALKLIDSFLPRSGHPKSRLSMLKRLTRAAAVNNQYDLLAVFPTHDLVELIGDIGRRRGLVPRAGAAAFRSWDVVDYLPFDLMRKTDTASMHVALEVRAPFLDSELVSAALATPMHVLAPRGRRKGLLRAVARRYFPPDIVDRPKMGFAIPIGEWFRSDHGGMKTLLIDTLHSADPFPASKLGLELNRTLIDRMLHEHMSEKRDHSQRLYMLLVLAIWAKTL